MDFELNTSYVSAELEVSTSNTKITEDISDYSGKIDESYIGNFIDLANQMHRHNGGSDVDFVGQIFQSYLNSKEIETFVDKYIKQD